MSETGDAARRALCGARVLVTRGADASAPLADRLASLGAYVVPCPAIAIAAVAPSPALCESLATLDRYAWLAFTSAHAVDAFAIASGSRVIPVPIAAVGAATAAALGTHGWTATFLPRTATGAGLAAELPCAMGDRILLPRGDVAGRALPDGLRARGAHVDEVVVYRTVADPRASQGAALLAAGQVDAIAFTSPSSIAHFVAGARHAGIDAASVRHRRRVAVVCIGPTTADAARAHDLAPDAIATEPSTTGLVDALSRALGARDRRRSA